ncbi:MAG: hypothetical protein ABSF28_15805 [Terracidiphilus sp.]|jgi:hypothetical protein
MNRSVQSCVFLVSVIGFACALPGQNLATPSDAQRLPCLEAYGDQQPYTTGKPFVATWTETMTQTRNDGTDSAPIQSLTKIARDSSGRVYQEDRIHPHNGIPYRVFSVDDPASGTNYVWTELDKTVHLSHFPKISSRETQEALRKNPWAKKSWAIPVCVTYGPDSVVDPNEFSIQNLGTSQILGIDAEGILATRNNDPVTEERWYSSDLRIALTTRVSDSRLGTAVREINSLERVEPDQSLFRIPAGYRIVDALLRHGENR